MAQRVRIACWTLGALVLLGAAGCEPYDPDELPGEFDVLDVGIVGGTTTQGWDQVVAYFSSGGGMCTGTLVDPQVVLTAAHCVEGSGSQDFIFVGSNINNMTNQNTHAVSDAIPHPQYNSQQLTNDIAVVLLNFPLSGVDIIPVNTEHFDNSWNGKWLHYVGFGSNTTYSGPGAGIKRETDIQINQYEATVYYHYTAGTNTCAGDSGGPGLVDRNGNLYVAGVNSAVGPIEQGQDYCEGYGLETRVDSFLSFLDDYFDPYDDPYGVGDDDDDASDDDDVVGDDDDVVGDDDTEPPVEFEDLPEPRTNYDYDMPVGCDCDVATRPVGPAASVLLLLVAAALRRRNG